MSKAFCSVAVLVAVCALPVVAQNQMGINHGFPDLSTGNPTVSAPNTPADPTRADWEAKTAKFQNEQRQVTLKQDTDKLLELATQLKQNVDHTGPNILSLDVVKKAQEIEKLAKSVKDKMKGD